MVPDAEYKPILRPVEVLPASGEDGRRKVIHDRSGLSDVALTISEPVLYILAHMDGTNTAEDIRRAFGSSFGQTLPRESLVSLLEQLEQAHLLEGPAFEAYFRSRQEKYRAVGSRPMVHAVEFGIEGADGGIFDEMLAEADQAVLPGPVRGLVAPHLDYGRGRPGYAAAYTALGGRATPQRVVILGTNHFGRSTSVVATASAFTTPLGRTEIDIAFLERLETQCGNLRSCELDHEREHSIELQVAWLQHLFGAEEFKMVPILCPDPCGPTGTAPRDGEGVDLNDFAVALRKLVAEDQSDTLIVAGADLSHVGAGFGDTRTLDDDFLEEVRRRDRCILDELEINDPASFLRRVAADDNPTRVCSAGCIYTLAVVLPDATATILRYHQAVDQSSQTCVTCAAAVFT